MSKSILYCACQLLKAMHEPLFTMYCLLNKLKKLALHRPISFTFIYDQNSFA